MADTQPRATAADRKAPSTRNVAGPGGLHAGWAGATAVEIATAVARGDATAREVVADHLAQIARLDGQVGAFEVVRRDEALAEAEALDATGVTDGHVLAGVPVAVKDVVDVAGLPTLHGSAALPSAPADTDDLLVQRLRDAGAIIVGKTRCPELSIWGVSDNVRGAAHNPWDLQRTPGGSSGGSAAAVAAGMVPVALASDGMGSIRIPAACCGLTGIKPGSGVVPMRFGDADEHWFGMTQYGPVATTVADAALFLDVLAGVAGDVDPAGGGGALDAASVTGSLRIAVHDGPAVLGTVVTRRYKRAVSEAAAALRAAGHLVVPARPPIGPSTIVAGIARWTAGASADAEVLGADQDRLEARTRGHLAAGRRLGRLVRVRDEQARRWQDRVAAFFADVDVLITPALLRSPIAAEGWRDRPWAANFVANAMYASMAAPWNLADVPAGVVPMAVGADGMPVAVQIVAPHGREDLVLAAAAALEAARPWPRHAPLASAG